LKVEKKKDDKEEKSAGRGFLTSWFYSQKNQEEEE